MKKTFISLLLVLALVLSMPAVAMGASFPDVAEDYEYQSAIELLTSLKVLGGYEDGTFKPENNITRAELCKVLYVIFGGNDDPTASIYKGASEFNDVAANVWFNGHVNWAASTGVVGGYGDGTFLPGNNIAVKEAVKMVVAAVTDKTLTYPMGYIQEAKSQGLLDGVTMNSTDAYATRGQVAQMAYNLLYTPSRLCLTATGDVDSNGNETYKKTAPIEFVFGLTAFGGEDDSDNTITLAATYDNMWTYTGGTLDEGQVALDINGKNYVFDYEGDASALFGQDLTIYLDTAAIGSNSKLVSIVSNSSAVSTTADKLIGNGSSGNPFRVNGASLALGTSYTANNTKFYAFETAYVQNSNGFFTKNVTDAEKNSYLKIADYFSKDGNNSSDLVTLIDADNDGTYETIVVAQSETIRVTAVSASSKTMKLQNAVGGKTQFSSIYVDGFDAFTGLDYASDSDPVYANITFARHGDGNVYLDAAVAGTKTGVLGSVSSNGMSAVIDGETYASVGDKSQSGVKGVFAALSQNIGDTVKVYLDANGYAADAVVTEENASFELSLGKVIAVKDDADNWGNNVTATATIVLADGTEKEFTFATDEENDDKLNEFAGDTAKSWSSAETNEGVYFSYNEKKTNYAIIDNYAHFELDDETGKIVRIAAIEDIEAVGGPTNTDAEWEFRSFDGNLCYNDEKGFYVGTEKKVSQYVGFASDDFAGMYYEKVDGNLETAYYTAANIPEFYEEGAYSLVFADGEVVAMIVTEAPDASASDRVFGVIKSWETVAGENKTANGSSTYRLAITMDIGGETTVCYTEDATANKLVNATQDGEKLEAGRLVSVQLLSNGKVAVTEASDGKIMVDLEYLTYGNVNFGYASYRRGSYLRVYNVNGVKNAVEAGWTLDKDGNMIYSEEAVAGEISLADSAYNSLMTCDETKVYTVNAELDDFDASTVSGGVMLQSITGVEFGTADSIPVSDADSGIYYVFAYTLLSEDTAADSDNAGCIGNVVVFELPVVTD